MKINQTQSIHLNNVQIFTNHGCLEEEKRIGSEYIVNLTVKADLSKSVKTDELEDTVDYVLLNNIVQEQMKIRSKLLEHVAGRILEKIGEIGSSIKNAKIKIEKVNPPMKGQMKTVGVEIEAEY